MTTAHTPQPMNTSLHAFVHGRPRPSPFPCRAVVVSFRRRSRHRHRRRRTRPRRTSRLRTTSTGRRSAGRAAIRPPAAAPPSAPGSPAGSDGDRQADEDHHSHGHEYQDEVVLHDGSPSLFLACVPRSDPPWVPRSCVSRRCPRRGPLKAELSKSRGLSAVRRSASAAAATTPPPPPPPQEEPPPQDEPPPQNEPPLPWRDDPPSAHQLCERRRPRCEPRPAFETALIRMTAPMKRKKKTSITAPAFRSPLQTPRGPCVTWGCPRVSPLKAELRKSRGSAQDDGHDLQRKPRPHPSPRAQPAARRVRHHDLRRDVGARRAAPGRSTWARVSRTPTAPRRSARPRSRRCATAGATSTRRAPASPSCAPRSPTHQRRFYGLGVRPGHRGAGHRGRHRGHRRVAAGAAGAGRRGGRARAVLRLVRGLHRDGRAARASRSRCAPPTALPPRPRRAARRGHRPRTRLLLLNTPHNPTGKVLTRDELAADRRAGRRARPRWSSPTRSTSTWSSTAPSTSRWRRFPGMRERTVTISSAGKTFSFTGWKVGWVTARRRRWSTAVRSAKQFLTYVAPGPFQHAVAEALALPDSYFDGAPRGPARPSATCWPTGSRTPASRCSGPPGTYFITTDIRPLGEKRRLRVLPRAAGAVRRGGRPERGVLRRREAGAPLRALRVLQARGRAEGGGGPAEDAWRR